MRARAVTAWVVVGVFVGGCGAPAASPAELARNACATARTVPMIGVPHQDSYQFSPDTAGDWVEALRDAAATAVTAAGADHAYDDLAHDLAVVRDDLADVRDALAADRAVVGDDLTVIEDHIAALVGACQGVDAID